MKPISIYSTIAAFVFTALFTSCAFLKHGEFAQRKYYNFPGTKHSENETASVIKQKKLTSKPAIVSENEHLTETLLSASINKKEIITSKAGSYNDKNSVVPRGVIETTRNTQIKSPEIAFKKSDIRKDAIKNTDHLSTSTDADTMLIILIILAIFIPPLAVYLKDKKINKWFWITLLLCIFSGGILFGGIGFGGLLWVIAAVIAILDVLDKL